jgi:hypothetical protein
LLLLDVNDVLILASPNLREIYIHRRYHRRSQVNHHQESRQSSREPNNWFDEPYPLPPFHAFNSLHPNLHNTLKYEQVRGQSIGDIDIAKNQNSGEGQRWTLLTFVTDMRCNL